MGFFFTLFFLRKVFHMTAAESGNKPSGTALGQAKTTLTYPSSCKNANWVGLVWTQAQTEVPKHK